MQHDETPAVLAHVGGNLRRARQKAGLSQADLAQRSGISRRTIINLEGGEANISLTGLDRLAEALGTSFATLVAAPGAVATAIDEITWRGTASGSEAVLLGSVPARKEAQLWTWTLGPGDRYDAQPDPEGWHEMLLVTRGALRLERAPSDVTLTVGQHVSFSTSTPYAYVNVHDGATSFARAVVN